MDARGGEKKEGIGRWVLKRGILELGLKLGFVLGFLQKGGSSRGGGEEQEKGGEEEEEEEEEGEGEEEEEGNRDGIWVICIRELDNDGGDDDDDDDDEEEEAEEEAEEKLERTTAERSPSSEIIWRESMAEAKEKRTGGRLCVREQGQETEQLSSLSSEEEERKRDRETERR